MLRTALAIALGAAAVAQAPATFPHVVLTELPQLAPRARLLEVDPTSGAVTPLGGFASDGLAPRAVTVDPYDGDLVVALDAGSGQSAVVRVRRAAGQLVELPIATVPGPVVELAVVGGDVFAAVDATNGGVFRMPRRGGAPTLALALPNLTAMHASGWWAPYIMLAWTGRPGSGQPLSGTGLYDFDAGAWLFGPDTFPNPTARETTGVVDLPTAVPRQVLSFDDGTFAMFAGLIGPGLTPIPTSPAIPPGGARALHSADPYSVAPWGLGGAAFPYLYELDAFSGAVTLRSQSLPGAPVDFAPGLTRAAHSEPYGTECGAAFLAQQWVNSAQLGTTFMVGVSGPPNAPVLLAAGLDDVLFGTLPAPLPGGCLLEVAPTVVTFQFSDPTGVAFESIVIPANPLLVGTVLHTQWVHYDPAGLSVSAAVAHWVGP